MDTVLFVLAAGSFLCGAIGLKLSEKFTPNWTDLGFFFLTVALFLV